MGSCWPTEGSQRSKSPNPLPIRLQEEKLADIRIDSSNRLLQSYQQLDKSTFQKRHYDWHSIPIITQFDCRGKTYFEVRNKGIKDSNFVVGVIKRSAVTAQLPMPWRTRYCICFESHQNPGESGLIFEGKVTKTGETVAEGEVVRIAMSQDEIQFRNSRKTLGYMKLPVDFLSDEVLPYVALFQQGDKIQFMQEVIVQ